ETGNLVKIHHAGQQTIYELHPEGSGKPLFVGIVDDTTIVAGPEKRFIGDAFIKSRSEKPARVKKELRELLEQVDAEQSIWFAATANAFLKGDWSGDERSRKSLQKMTGLTAGLTVDRGIQVAFAISAKSAAHARELGQEIKLGLEQAKGLL